MPERNEVRILIVDYHPVLLEGIQLLLSRLKGAQVVGHAINGEEAVDLARELLPDIILMDVSMAPINGIEATRRVLAHNKAAAVIMLTMHDGVGQVRDAARAGARGYVLKSSPPGLILQAIETVAGGGTFFDPQIADMLQQDAEDLSAVIPALAPRERQVLALLAQGRLNKEIADELSLSVRTVETYRERLMSKLQIHSVAELTRYAVAEKIVLLD